MRFAVCGGDESAVRLCRMLAGDGHQVRAFALDEARLPPEVLNVCCPEGALKDAEVAVLPSPAAGPEGRLNTPLCRREYFAADILKAVPRETLICAGEAQSLPEGRYVEDYTLRAEYAAGRAAIAAEGAVELALRAGDTTVLGSRVLVLGWGRLGKLLAARLRDMGANVTVASRRPGDRALIRALGCRSSDFLTLPRELGGYEMIFNTVPALVLDTIALTAISSKTLLAELASPPGGFDSRIADELGIHTVTAGGLAGKCAPETAAELLRDAVYGIVEEWRV